MSFQRSEAVALSGFLLAWQKSNLPLRRPSWNRPTFWSRTVTKQIARPVAAGTAMADFLSVSGLPGYVAVVDRLTMTAVGAPTDIQFQVVVNGAPVPATSYPVGIELNKTASTTYPAIPREFYYPVLETETLTVRVANLGALQRTILVGIYGWFYSTVDATDFRSDNGVTDAGYTPVVGGP